MNTDVHAESTASVAASTLNTLLSTRSTASSAAEASSGSSAMGRNAEKTRIPIKLTMLIELKKRSCASSGGTASKWTSSGECRGQRTAGLASSSRHR